MSAYREPGERPDYSDRETKKMWSWKMPSVPKWIPSFSVLCATPIAIGALYEFNQRVHMDGAYAGVATSLGLIGVCAAIRLFVVIQTL